MRSACCVSLSHRARAFVPWCGFSNRNANRRPVRTSSTNTSELSALLTGAAGCMRAASPNGTELARREPNRVAHATTCAPSSAPRVAPSFSLCQRASTAHYHIRLCMRASGVREREKEIDEDKRERERERYTPYHRVELDNSGPRPTCSPRISVGRLVFCLFLVILSADSS